VTTPSPTLTEADVVDSVSRALRPSVPGRGTVGLEVEWIVVDGSNPSRVVTGDEVLAAAGGALPGGGGIGVEPGGQLELTTLRHADAWRALEAAATDEVVLRERAGQVGLRLLATGIDPFRAPHRSLDLPRYRAMEAAFDARGPEGRLMMCSTAALQVNVDFGVQPLATWERAARVAPVLAAAFANSPRTEADGSSTASARSAVWAAIDRSRTRPVPVGPAEAWAAYALDADVLFIREGDAAHPVGPSFSLRRWITDGHPLGFPDGDDVAEHLTTLFPPVRPRGWLECRFLDALEADDRLVAVLTLAALVGDDTPLDAVRAACAPVADPWPLVPTGTADPGMRRAAEQCMDLAAEVLERQRPGASTPVRWWTDRRRATAWEPTAPDLQSLVTLEQEIH